MRRNILKILLGIFFVVLVHLYYSKQFVFAQTDETIKEEPATEKAATDEADISTPAPANDQPLSLTPAPANDQPLSLTISPTALLLDTDPGKQVDSSFQVFNNSSKTEYLTVKVIKFTANQTGNAPVLQEFTQEDEYKEWLTFNTTKIKVEPKTWQTVKVYFSPPEHAALSYYYAILITRETNVTIQQGETATIGAPALLTLATVNSPLAKQELQLKNFKATKKIFEFLPVEFELTVENTGNVHLAPIGNIFIDGFNQKDIGNIQLNKTNGLILPGSTRTYTISWQDGFPTYINQEKDGKIILDKNNNPKKKLSWDFSKIQSFRIGKYTGHLVFIYDNGIRDVPTEAKVSFWVIPVRILLVVAIILTLASVGIIVPIILLVKKLKQKKDVIEPPVA